MKVTMYKANDGSIHPKKTDMERVNRALRLKPAAEKFVASLDDSQFDDVEGRYLAIAKDDLADFLVNNADALRQTLNDALVVRRARKKATTAAKEAEAPAA